MQQPSFAPGFRLSVSDIVVLIVGASGALALGVMVWWWGFVIGFAVGHFFLFCNIVRMARPLELLWAGVFVALAVATITWGVPGWPLTAVLSLVVTAVVVWLQMRSPSYHGLGWQRINPGLPAWWEAQAGQLAQRSAVTP